MLTANVSEIKESVLPNFNFNLNFSQKMGLFLSEWVYF